MRIKRLALLTFTAMSLSTAALADGGGFLKSADLNKDGTIDQTEFQAARDKWFQELDANHDGFVTSDELKAFGDQMRAGWAQKHADQTGQGGTPTPGTAPEGRHGDFAEHVLKHVDTDGDGKISKAEFDAEGATLFKRFDQNGDGKIASDEMPEHRWAAAWGGHMFDQIDADKDGKITKAEFTAAGDRMFQQLDKNGDGVIERDELKMPMHDGDGAPVPPTTAPDQPPTP